MRPCRRFGALSAERHVEHHHDGKPQRKEHGADVRVLALRHFRDQFFDDNVKHRTSGKAQQIRQRRDNEACGKDREHRADRLDNAGEQTGEKRAGLFHTVCTERHGDDCALRKVLDRDADGQCKRTRCADFCTAREEPRIDHADRHTLGNVMQRDRKHHHGRLCKTAFRPLRRLAVAVQMGNDAIEQQQEQNARPKADDRRYERPFAAARFRLVERRNEQAPDGSRDHDACGKARQRALYTVAQRVFHEKDTGCAERRSEKRDQYAPKHFCLHRKVSHL